MTWTGCTTGSIEKVKFLGAIYLFIYLSISTLCSLVAHSNHGQGQGLETVTWDPTRWTGCITVLQQQHNNKLGSTSFYWMHVKGLRSPNPYWGTLRITRITIARWWVPRFTAQNVCTTEAFTMKQQVSHQQSLMSQCSNRLSPAIMSVHYACTKLKNAAKSLLVNQNSIHFLPGS